MAIKLSKICFVLVFLLAASSATGQVPGATPTLQEKVEIQRKISEEQAGKRERESSDRMMVLSDIQKELRDRDAPTLEIEENK
jgi:hypothetical protein